jgi:hypothetical protein
LDRQRRNENAKRLKNLSVWQPKLNIKPQRLLCSLDNFAGFNAAGANLHASVTPGRELNTDRLQIRIKAATCFVVRM